MRYIGIDGGLKGAVGVIGDEGRALGVVSTPTTITKSGRSKKTVYLPADMLAILKKATGDEEAHVFIEIVHAMPRDKGGTVSAFSMGRGMGYWEMACVALGIPYTFVTPPVWKKKMFSGQPGSDKGASIARAKQLFPNMARKLTRKGDDGRAEALLIALYGYWFHEKPVSELWKELP